MPFSDKHMDILATSPLFMGLSAEEIRAFLRLSGAAPLAVEAGRQLVRQGETRPEIHLILSGAAVGERLESDGSAVIVNEFSPGEIFGDMLSGAREKSPVTVTMTTDGELLKMPFSSLVGSTAVDAMLRERVLRNLIGEIAGKYFALQRRLELLLCPSLRGKIAAYLLAESKRSGGDEFTCPHSRDRQAQLLGCDRSALSRELSRMKRDGLIDYSRRSFRLLDPGALMKL